MFNVLLDYPSFEEEMNIVKSTTVDSDAQLNTVLSVEDIIASQRVIRRMPVPDNVCEYAVRLVSATRPDKIAAPDSVASRYISWGAGPRASQYLIIGARTHAALMGKYSPDIEDVQSVATEVLRHRIVGNYYAEAEGISIDSIIQMIMEKK